MRTTYHWRTEALVADLRDLPAASLHEWALKQVMNAVPGRHNIPYNVLFETNGQPDWLVTVSKVLMNHEAPRWIPLKTTFHEAQARLSDQYPNAWNHVSTLYAANWTYPRGWQPDWTYTNDPLRGTWPLFGWPRKQADEFMDAGWWTMPQHVKNRVIDDLAAWHDLG